MKWKSSADARKTLPSDSADVRKMHSVTPDAGLALFWLLMEVALTVFHVEKDIAGSGELRTPPLLDQMCDQMILLGNLSPGLTAQTWGWIKNETSRGGSDLRRYEN